MDYKTSGVNIKKADAFVEDIKDIAGSTFDKNVLKGIGLFGSFFRIPQPWMPPYMLDPVLVSSTDGVGTKIEIACMLNKHEGIGQDLVAMCVNDVITSGAIPMFFLDYFATGELVEERDRIILNSIADACKQAKCALIGGETAEMPGFYSDGKYDLAGFAVGFASEDHLIDGSRIQKGNKIIGISSNGVHSNGFSLIRHIYADSVASYNEPVSILPQSHTLGEELLKPTHLYVDVVTSIMESIIVNGMVHVTGGGIFGNLDRIIPQGLTYIIDKLSWEIPYIFSAIQTANIEKGIVIDKEEMYRVFNMGIGYIIVVDENDVDLTMELINQQKYSSFVIGEIIGP